MICVAFDMSKLLIIYKFDDIYIIDTQNEPAGRILELCILHLAMSEISVLGTRHQIVINEVNSFFVNSFFVVNLLVMILSWSKLWWTWG